MGLKWKNLRNDVKLLEIDIHEQDSLIEWVFMILYGVVVVIWKIWIGHDFVKFYTIWLKFSGNFKYISLNMLSKFHGAEGYPVEFIGENVFLGNFVVISKIEWISISKLFFAIVLSKAHLCQDFSVPKCPIAGGTQIFCTLWLPLTL